MRISDWSSDVCSSDLIKRSVNLFGHATSISLEPVFWRALKRAADEEGLPLNTLVARIDEARSDEHTSELQSLMRISYAVFCSKKRRSDNCARSEETTSEL